MSLCRLAQQVICQKRNVFCALCQSRNFQADNVEAVIEIFAEFPARHRFWQVTVSGRNNPHVDINIAVTAQRAHFTLLQHAQQFDLQRCGHIANLIEK